MGVVLEKCVKMDDGRLLCWDDTDKCAYVIDPKKERATERNVTAKEWMALSMLLGEKGLTGTIPTGGTRKIMFDIG